MAKMNIFLEMEIGKTGGEEDGVKHEGTIEDLFTSPEQVRYLLRTKKRLNINNFSYFT